MSQSFKVTLYNEEYADRVKSLLRHLEPVSIPILMESERFADGKKLGSEFIVSITEVDGMSASLNDIRAALIEHLRDELPDCEIVYLLPDGRSVAELLQLRSLPSAIHTVKVSPLLS